MVKLHDGPNLQGRSPPIPCGPTGGPTGLVARVGLVAGDGTPQIAWARPVGETVDEMKPSRMS